MLSGIVSFLSALPTLLSLISRIGEWLAQESTKKWIAELHDATGKLEKAKTTEDRTDAARSLVRLIRTL
jgi:hypothetical protein